MVDYEPSLIDKASTEFLRQWKQVVLSHPLIAASLMMQDQSFAKVVSQRLSSAPMDWISVQNQADLLARAFGDSDTAVSVAERFAHALRELDKDLGRAKSDDETAAAFERFGRRWRGEEEMATPRDCPDCKGTGKIGSNDCQRCRGTGQIW